MAGEEVPSRANGRPEAVVACFGAEWRAAADEDGHYSLAIPYDAAARDALQLASLRCSAV
jgi:hypothetical protein